MSNLKTQSHSVELKTNLKYRSYAFSLAIIRFVATFPSQRIYSIIGDQLLRSATSVGANIIEAKSSSSRRDFIRFYDIALKSANETLYWLCLLRDGGLADRAKIAPMLDEAEQLSRMLGSSLLTLKGRK